MKNCQSSDSYGSINICIHFVYLKMSYRAYNFIVKIIARSWNILLNKEETKLLKFYFIYIKI